MYNQIFAYTLQLNQYEKPDTILTYILTRILIINRPASIQGLSVFYKHNHIHFHSALWGQVDIQYYLNVYIFYPSTEREKELEERASFSKLK